MPSPDAAALSSRVVIVGAGHAGGTAAIMLRQSGHVGPIALIGDELVPPYQRPPLSKAYLKGETGVETLKLKPDSFYSEQQVDLHLGANVVSVDRNSGQVATLDGRIIPYDILILATGARARKLDIPGAGLQGVHQLRSVADAESLRTMMQPGHRLVIIGGGYVGLEAASAARSLGTEVVVIERETHVLARVASEPVAEFFQTFHRGRGVEIICAASVTAFEGERHGRVRGVSLASGASISCDAVLVGVGATSCDALAQNAKLQCANGVVVDSKAQTSDPRIFAIGDVTSRPLSVYDNQMFRLESVPNALEQAKQAVHAMLGLPEPAPAVPWFWSDQYDLKLQIAGLPFDRDDWVTRGSAEQRRFSVFHMKADRIVSVEALNSPAEFMVGRKLIGMKCAIARDLLADAKVPMKSLANLGS